MPAVPAEQELRILLADQAAIAPPEEFVREANVTDPSIYDEAERDFEKFWDKWASELDWFEHWGQVLDWRPPHARWFVDGKLNVSHNCLDRHVEAGRGEKTAYHWRGEDGSERSVTYAELLTEVKKFANVLKRHGIASGDVVGLYMPMLLELPIAMLACARIGAAHNVVFGGFSADAVRERMVASDAKLLVTVDHSLRRGKTAPTKADLDPVLPQCPSIEKVIVVRRTGDIAPMQSERDLWWHEQMEGASDECPATPLDSEHPLFILYTSGSTAKPKGVLHTTGGYLTGVYATAKLVFDLKDSDIYWCAADIGWVTGHSYIVYGPLANGVTSIIYEGAPDYPAKDVWWQIVEKFKVTILYTAPTAIRSFMKWGEEHIARHDLSSLRLLGSVGEPINPKAWLWYQRVIGSGRCPIVDTWWQTETGMIMIAPLPGVTATKPGSATRPLPGIKAAIYDSQGDEVREGGGRLVLLRPWPAMLRSLYNEPERYVSTYWSEYGSEVYVAGDAAKRDADGYIWVIGRTDDVIIVSGHRFSTMEIESAIVSHEGVAEAAVVGQQDDLTGHSITAFVTLKNDFELPGNFESELSEHVSAKIGKIARPKRFIWSDDLPKTRSGKIMRRLLRDIAEGRELGDVTTLRDPTVTEELAQIVASRQSEEE